MTTTTMPTRLPRMPAADETLGALILALTEDVAADRAEGIRNGPTEQWRDALAVCWLRQHLAVQPWGQR